MHIRLRANSFSRRTLLRTAIGATGCAAVSAFIPTRSAAAAVEPVAEWLLRAARIVQKIKHPVIPDVSYTAPLQTGDSAKRNNAVLQQAIYHVSEGGGGRVVVPKGEWDIAGPLRLTSHIDLHIQEGATLRFADDKSYHLPPVLTRWEGTDMIGYSPYVYAYQASNVAITGSGTLDGNGSSQSSSWRDRSEGDDITRLREMGRHLTPIKDRVFGEGHSLRPSFIQFYGCTSVKVEGVHIEDVPFWGLHFLYSTDIAVRHVSVSSFASNNDGIDIDSSSRVLVEHCRFETKDDCITVKSGRDADGRNVGRPSEDIVIRDCEMIFSDSSGVAIGSEMSGGVRNVYIIRCAMNRVHSALTVKSNLDRGGIVENIRLWNVTIDSCSHILRVTTAYHSYSGGNFPPALGDIALDDVRCKNAELAFTIVGSPESPIGPVSLRGISVQHATETLHRQNAPEIAMTNVVIGD